MDILPTLLTISTLIFEARLFYTRLFFPFPSDPALHPPKLLYRLHLLLFFAANAFYMFALYNYVSSSHESTSSQTLVLAGLLVLQGAAHTLLHWAFKTITHPATATDTTTTQISNPRLNTKAESDSRAKSTSRSTSETEPETKPTHLSFALSTDAPTHILTTGPYHYIRHPTYTAYLLYYGSMSVLGIYSGLSSSTASGIYKIWAGILFWVTTYAEYWWLAVGEEKKFERSGDEKLRRAYDEYRKGRGRIFGGPF